MREKRFSTLELYNSWLNGTYIDDLCKMAGVDKRKTLYKRFDRLRYRHEKSTLSTNNSSPELVNKNSKINCENKGVDKVNNNVEVNQEIGIDAKERINPIVFFIAVIIIGLIALFTWLYKEYEKWKMRQG